MKLIGSIKQVQIQRFSLKFGQKPHVTYNPSPIQVVEQLQLTSDGVVGIIDGPTAIIDIHNIQHPTTHHNGGNNGISFNFTAHYQEIRQAYGEHVYDGCAGENILIETDQHYRLADLGAGLIIERAQDQQQVELYNLSCAVPCLEFSHFVLHRKEEPGNEQIKHALQFLHHGQRGFYALVTEGPTKNFIQAGDRVYSAD
ncbi:hypothetical protein KDW_62210 [Dictyobacter vulcani]|uniref:MOSC domain-containing protein n=1 Tax=Dictyobacter vulcani TaxID=2607529 RepID=A0A5J4L193_9CHLR|nr:hypothetical protein [Dictyobacter vulcani]GER92059.1 hypothetical protein KDW_62210 [Dictyobacter vulcani]